MTLRTLVFAGGALAAVVSVAGSARANQTFTFNYTAPYSGGAVATASGVFTTTDFDSMLGAYTIIGITGTRAFNGQTNNITGLIPPRGYLGNSNLLYYPNQPYLDGGGFSYTIDANNSARGNNKVNFYLFDTGYGEDGRTAEESFDFVVTPVVADVPEPGAVAFGIVAAGVLGLVARKRKG